MSEVVSPAPAWQEVIFQSLKQAGVTNVGMVYTQHHGHGEMDRFAELTGVSAWGTWQSTNPASGW